MSYIGIGLDVLDLRKSYSFYVEELRCFRLGGTRFYSDAGIEGMLKYNEIILSWVGAENVELMLRKVDILPTHIGNESALLLQIDDIEEEFVRLKNGDLASGAKVISESLLDTPHGDTFWIRDPSGHVVQLLPSRRLGGN